MVSDESPIVLGERLKEARRARGLTQAEAAQHLGVSRPTLIAVEQGRRRPTPTELMKLADLYGRRMHELMRSSPPVEALAASFRLSPGDAKSATDVAVDSLERVVDDVLELEQISGVSLAKNYPPVYDIEGLPIDAAAEQLAVSERHRLGLGDGPVLELRNLLEGEVGLRIFSLPLPARVAGLFAFSERAGACIGINAGHPLDRQRWTLAHECAHFLTDRWSAEVTRLPTGSLPHGELFAETFAANFLMPASSVTRRFQAARRSRASNFTAADLLQLASEYQVSAMALAIRLKNLGLLAAGWWDTLESRGFKVTEAQDQLGIPRMPQDHELLPQRIKYVAIEAYLNGELSEGQLARLFKMDRVDTREAVDRLMRSFDTNIDGGVQTWTWTGGRRLTMMEFDSTSWALDACAAINFAAILPVGEFSTAMGAEIVAVRQAANESHCLHDYIDGEKIRTPIDLRPLTILDLAEQEFADYVALAAHMTTAKPPR